MTPGTIGRSLWEVFKHVPDHRDASGRRYPLPAVLCMAVAASLAGRSSLAAICRWAKKLPAESLRSMGIWRGKSPCHSSWHYIFKGLKVDALESALGAWVGSSKDPNQKTHVAMDGKVARGSGSLDYPALHLLAMYSEALQGVLGQWQVSPDSNEITAAMEMLRSSTLENLVITGDAIFAQREICREIKGRDGDYLFVVKENQPALKEHIEAAFTPPISPLGGALVGA